MEQRVTAGTVLEQRAESAEKRSQQPLPPVAQSNPSEVKVYRPMDGSKFDLTERATGNFEESLL